MTSYTKQAISYAVDLVHSVAEQPPQLAATSKENIEVAAWVEDAIRTGQSDALTEFLGGCGPAGSDAYGLARGLIRSVSSYVSVDGQALLLFAIPFMVDAEVETPLRRLESRQTIERALESAQGLPFLSLRMCEYPIRRVELDALGALDLAKVTKDIGRYSSSKKLAAPTIGPGPEHLVWLGIYRLPGDDARQLFANRNGRALHEWRNKSQVWLAQELSSLKITHADVMIPLRIQEALNTSRIYQLKTELNTARIRIAADEISFKKQAAQLSWKLVNSVSGEVAKHDIWLPDESTASVIGSLKHFAEKFNLTLTS